MRYITFPFRNLLSLTRLGSECFLLKLLGFRAGCSITMSRKTALYVNNYASSLNLLVPLRGGLKGGADNMGELFTTEWGVKRGVGLGGADRPVLGKRGVGAGRGGAMTPAPSTSCSNLNQGRQKHILMNLTDKRKIHLAISSASLSVGPFWAAIRRLQT